MLSFTADKIAGSCAVFCPFPGRFFRNNRVPASVHNQNGRSKRRSRPLVDKFLVQREIRAQARQKERKQVGDIEHCFRSQPEAAKRINKFFLWQGRDTERGRAMRRPAAGNGQKSWNQSLPLQGQRHLEGKTCAEAVSVQDKVTLRVGSDQGRKHFYQLLQTGYRRLCQALFAPGQGYGADLERGSKEALPAPEQGHASSGMGKAE